MGQTGKLPENFFVVSAPFGNDCQASLGQELINSLICFQAYPLTPTPDLRKHSALCQCDDEFLTKQLSPRDISPHNAPGLFSDGPAY